jgi:RNA polymerase sigma factor (sigma-70 family)
MSSTSRLLSDDRLARRAAQGDPRAFEAIYERYHQELYRFCQAMVGNPADAQDALQNTMVKVLRGLPGEQREIRLKPWLYRIARNESVETLRRRRQSEPLGSAYEAAAGRELAETAEARERLRTLLADLEELPQRQRAALVMRELSGLDFEEIGAAFGSSAAVARQTLYEARLSLRQLEAGREMPCADVMRELSDGDGRVTRRREIRAHLRGCADCRAFHDEIAARRQDLAALAPLPLAASAGLLRGVLGSKVSGGASGSGLAGATGAGAGKAVATSAIVKSAATLAVVAAVGVSTADRAGLVHLPGSGEQAVTSGAVHGTASGGASSESGVVGRRTGADGAQARGDGADTGASGQNAAAAGQVKTSNEHQGASRGRGSSHSQKGLNPPGGGYGRSASKRHGRPEQPPDASNHGQQTAAAHKPAHAQPAPDHGAAAGGDHGQPSHPEAAPPQGPAPKVSPPAAQPETPNPPVEPPAADDESPATSPGRPSQKPQG